MSEIRANKSATLIFAEAVVRRKFPILIALIISTAFFFFPILNALLLTMDMGWKNLPAINVDTQARDQWPDHPFISAQDKFANKFGGSSTIAIAVVVKEGTIFTPDNLARINRITQRLDGRGYNSHIDERDEMRDLLADSLGQLTEQERLVVALYYYEELTLKEIGQVLELSESRVSQLHTKAVLGLRSKLRKRLMA